MSDFLPETPFDPMLPFPEMGTIDTETAAPPPRNLSDPRQNKSEEKRAKRRAQLCDAAIAMLMEHTEGRVLLWELLCFCNVNKTSFDHNALAMAFREGHRNVGLRLVADIMRVAPENYARMQQDYENA